jgi:Spy/CpxP family protein refolding chaperone
VAVPWSRFQRHFADPGSGGMSGGPFGVRRPLRFLAWKLGLSEEQVAQLATVLNELKTERAQHEVDDRRSVTLLADAVAGETFDSARADEAAKLRNDSAQRLHAEIAKAAGRIHALLDPEQRARFAYLLRTGALAM